MRTNPSTINHIHNKDQPKEEKKEQSISESQEG
jgi:hypothetical protein